MKIELTLFLYVECSQNYFFLPAPAICLDSSQLAEVSLWICFECGKNNAYPTNSVRLGYFRFPFALFNMFSKTEQHSFIPYLNWYSTTLTVPTPHLQHFATHFSRLRQSPKYVSPSVLGFAFTTFSGLKKILAFWKDLWVHLYNHECLATQFEFLHSLMSLSCLSVSVALMIT